MNGGCFMRELFIFKIGLFILIMLATSLCFGNNLEKNYILHDNISVIKSDTENGNTLNNSCVKSNNTHENNRNSIRDNITCEQHDFGSAGVSIPVYANKSWTFTAGRDMAITSAEVSVVYSNPKHSFGSYLALKFELSINDKTIDIWSTPIHAGSFSTDTHQVETNMEMSIGDIITLRAFGGVGSFSAAFVSGPNYVKLCSTDISVYPTSFGTDNLKTVAIFDVPGTSDPTDLAFDGTNLYSADYDGNIYKIDLEGNIIFSFAGQGTSPWGLTWDGSYLWNSDYNNAMIYQLDSSGSVISSFNSPGSKPVGLAFDGSNIWNCDSNEDKMFKLDSSGNVIDSFAADCSGITFDGTHLWTSKAPFSIDKLDFSGNVIQSYDAPGNLPRGLTFDCRYLWHTDATFDKLFQLEPPITIGSGQTENRSFTVSNNSAQNVTLSNLTISGANSSEFTLNNDSCSGQSLSPSGTCTFTILLSPTSNGSKSATLSITSTANDLTVPLSATVGGNTPALYDFNSDGKSDIFYRQPANGKVGVWLMDGLSEDSWVYIQNHGTAWNAGGVGDFNNDGSVDVVFRHTNGMVGVWLMNGTTEDTWQPLGNHGTAWNVKGVGDFNNDGFVDVIYRNDNGMVGVWLMNGTTEDTWQPLGNHGTAWDVKGAGDFNNDGSVDVIYRHNNGMVGLWLMNGTTENTWHAIQNHGTAWDVASVGDFNNDGSVDMVFQNTNGMVGVWLMNGTTEDTWQSIANHGVWKVR